jgi:aminoglycoside phosphotransferase (APT) family kinase protein
MLVREFLPSLAGELGLHMVAPLPGGTFGAALVADREGQEFVLKADPTNTWSTRFARGALLAEELRGRGYPAPLHVATGVALDASWSLQERLRGTAPRPLTEAHASRMVALARMHADAAPSLDPIDVDDTGDAAAQAIARLSQAHTTQRVAAELQAVLKAHADVVLQTGDIAHNDFSHRNVLAIGDEVTGVIDWEQAAAGDWRMDLATLSYWAALEPDAATPAAATLIATALRDVCPPPVLAVLFARLALRHVDLDARMRPKRLPPLLRAIETRIAPWWRSAAAA